MITLINPPGIKTFSGLQMHTPNPPLGLAYIAAALREAGFEHRVIDATGEALDALYWTMLWLFVNFYVISFALRPWRVVRALVRAAFTGGEETRYAKWFVDVLFTRRRWRRLAGGAAR